MKVVSKEEIKHIAKLANLTITEKEADMYKDQLGNVLDYVNELSSVDTSDVEEINVSALKNVFREDKINENNSLKIEEALGQTNNTKNGLFKVEKILERDK